MTTERLDAYLLGLDGVWREPTTDEGIAFYKLGEPESAQLVAVIDEAARPLQVSLRCDARLARLLREQYETVLPGKNLDHTFWNTILCTGQLADDELIDLARLSYELAVSRLDKAKN